MTGREAGRDNVPVADALPGRPAAAVGASTDFEAVDRHQPRRAHLRQRGVAVVARGYRAHPPCRQQGRGGQPPCRLPL